MSKPFTLDFIQNKLREKYGDLITIVPETFVKGNKYAVFIDKEFGSWRTKVRRVLNGSVCRKRAKRSTIEQVQEKLNKLYSGDVIVVPESYKKVGLKATFIDKQFGTYDSLVMNVLLGHRGGLNKYKHLNPVTHEPLIDLWQQAGGNKITMQKVVSKYGVNSALKYLEENLDENGQYQKHISSLEIRFQELVKGLAINTEYWNREALEIKDISDKHYRPDFKLGYNDKIIYVDVHGLFHHSAKQKLPKYHFDRRIVFEKVGIRYFQFYEDEIRDKPEIVKSILLNAFGLTSNKYFARKLELKPVAHLDARKFFEQNHLMGPHLTSKSIGLYNGDELICCLSFRNSFNKGKLDIARFATKLNTSCIGGFGKLVNYLKQFNKPIVSYCDLRYATGKSYIALNFNEIGTTLGWEWTNGINRFNRTKCKAGNGKTERENAEALGWFRIYDGGQRKYQLETPVNEEKKGGEKC